MRKRTGTARRAAVTVAFLVPLGLGLVACTFVQDLAYLQRGGAEGGLDEASAPNGDAADAGDVSTSTCPPQGRVRPVRFFDYVPQVIDGGQALTCNLGAVLEEDGNLAKLDRTRNGADGRGVLRGYEIAGCVGVEFDASTVLTNIVVRLGPVADGCGVTPCDPDGGCNSALGLQAYVFAGPTLAELDFVSNPKYGTILETRKDQVPSNTHVVVVCRGGNVSVTRDDVGVDAIWSDCR
jgi:hypothetical protein